MLGRRNTGVPEAIETLIGKNVKIEGKLISEGSVRIDGQVEGHVQCQGDLIVGASARIAASVKAKSVSVSGEILGNVTAGRVELASTARVVGDIDCSELAIETGALFTGKTQMRKEASKVEVTPSIGNTIVPAVESGQNNPDNAFKRSGA
ncbi:MAG TPA: polymer-forming cytoskeletal protein [Firmicutes bacterium]|nr:polymer-forming cytoskeletal protein [Bacillota bacterium]